MKTDQQPTDIEFERIKAAQQQILAVANRYASLVEEFRSALGAKRNPAATVQSYADKLWQTAVLDVQQGSLDDRPLYWARIAMQNALKEAGLASCAPLLEWRSRNSPHATLNRSNNAILISGFDPFSLHRNIHQSNPSGVFALALQNQDIEGFQVTSMVFPVRYDDFDDGCVERSFTSALQNNQTQLLITVSMGRDGFDLERFPAKCRSSSQPDNCGIDITQRANRFTTPLEGPEFFEFTLLATALGFDQLDGVHVTDNRLVETVEHGKFHAKSLRELQDCRAIAGSGGNFLSNEIAYRSLRLRAELGSTIPMGHIHVPRIEGYDATRIKADLNRFRQLLKRIVELTLSRPGA